MTHFSSSYTGNVEEDEHGSYSSYDECKANCSARENKELMYLVHEYDLESALLLAPSDRVAVLRRLTGVTLNPFDSYDILKAIIINDYETLARVDELLPWIRARHPFALVFEVPAGTLSILQIVSFANLSNQQITDLAVQVGGINLSNLKRGDAVRFADIPIHRGQLVCYDTTSQLLERTPYRGYNLGSSFAINAFPRVDYFRYSLPGSMVRLRKRWLTPFDQAVITQIGTRLWRVELGNSRHVLTITRFCLKYPFESYAWYGLFLPNSRASNLNLIPNYYL
jgi:hypothetical protein